MALGDNQIILEVENLTASFPADEGRRNAIENIHLKLRAGKTLAVVGESGSGKSVTSLAIMGLLPFPIAKIEGGKILYGTRQENLVLWQDQQMQKIRGSEIAMIFQEPMTSLNPVIQCGKQVEESARNHLSLSKAEAKKKVLDLFQDVKLPDPERAYTAYPHELSGGQKQRIMIAMAMICSPKILIADEPTTALDVTVQKEILELMADLQKKHNTALLFITHDLGVVKDISDYILVMHQGKMVEFGKADIVFNAPQNPYTKGLIACRPAIQHRLLKLPLVQDFLDTSTPYQPIYEDEAVRNAKHLKLYTSPSILSVSSLTKVFDVRHGLFGKKTAVRSVDDVSFEVFPGETLGLVGESGCGKTTLSRSLLRLIEPTSGEVYYRNTNILDLNAKELRQLRRKVQIIFQDPYSSLNPRLTVGAAILEPMANFNIGFSNAERIDRVHRLLEEVGLDGTYFNRYPHEFSGGQRQRIVIARTLATNPEFIICDESVSALDVSVQAQVLNLLNELKEKYGLTLIFISHDLSVVKHMSDRILVMNKGKVEELQEADELFRNPQSDYTKRLIASIPGS